MNYDGMKNFLFKRIALNTKTGLFFRGTVQLVEQDSLTLRDAFGDRVVIAFDNVAEIREVGNRG